MKAMLSIAAVLCALIPVGGAMAADEFWKLEVLTVPEPGGEADICNATLEVLEDPELLAVVITPPAYEYWLIGAKQTGELNYDYFIFLGPDPEDMGVAAAAFVRDGPGGRHKEIAVTQGVAYFFGDIVDTHPYGGTDGGSGVGEGTGFTVWSRPGAAQTDYFVCLEGTKLDVYSKDGGDPEPVLLNQYIEVPADGDLTGSSGTKVTREATLADLRNRTWLTILLADKTSVKRPLPY